MKRALRAWMAEAGRISVVWRLFEWLEWVGRCLAEPMHQARMAQRRARDARLAARLSPALTVLHGPFRGLRYAHAESAGSTLLPKLLGSYERELQHAFEKLLETTYTDVIDIGCAEGYYAVGLARRMPTTRVHAFDIDPRARELCRQMARLNGVEARVQIGDHCDATSLAGMALGPRALVLSDCEGCESQLFTPAVARALSAHDVLIEVHDRKDPDLGQRLRAVFGATHLLEVIDSIDDTRKLRSYHFAEIEGMDAAAKRDLLSEGRGMVMEWLVLRSRASVQASSMAPMLAAVA